MDKDEFLASLMKTDEEAKKVFGTEEPSRAAVGVMHRSHGADLFGPRQPGMGPMDHGAFGANLSFQPPVKAEQTRFDLGPAQKNSGPSGAYATPEIQISEMPMEMEPENLEMPAMLNAFSLFDDEEYIGANQEMLCEEPLEDGAIPRLEPFDFGCKTSLVSSREPEQVLEALRTAIVILESTGSEITHEDEGWQMRVEYIWKSSHASVSINLLETNDGEVAICFTRSSGHGWVFQRFYRQCVTQLRNVLPDVRGLGTNSIDFIPTEEAIEDGFDASGIVVDARTVHEALQNNIAMMSSCHNNKHLEPKREVTSAMVQLINAHPENCLTFARTAKFTQPMTALMEECSSDPEVMRNCVRAFNILMEKGQNFDNKSRVCQLLSVTPAFAIVANCVREALNGPESAAAVSMVCNDLCRFLGHLVNDYYSQGVKPSEQAVDALRGVVHSKFLPVHRGIHEQCNKLLSTITIR